MTKSLSIPYAPNPVPGQVEDLPRYIYDELARIKEALVAQPVSFDIANPDHQLAIGTTPNWEIGMIGIDPRWEVPGGEFDSATGRWTCPKSGLYQVNAHAEVAPFGSGNKIYYAGIRLQHERDLAIVETFESTDGGDDDIPLGVTLSGLVPLLQGDVLYTEWTAVHENQTGTVTAKAAWQILWQA